MSATPIIAELSGPLPKLAIVVLALLAAAAMLAPAERARAGAMLGALVLAPVLLLADIWDSPQLDLVHRQPLVAVLVALLAIAVLAALAIALARWPPLLPILALVALPFRVPIETGGETANLLVPLYLVIAAGALAAAAPVLARRASEAVAPIAGGATETAVAPEATAPEAGAAHRPRAGRGALEWLLAASIVLYALQAAYSPDFDKALQQVVFFYAPFALLYALLVRVRWTRALVARCFGALVALGLLFSAIGFFEYATRTILLNPRLLLANDFHTYFRVNSVFFDPNIYGRFLVVAMLALAGALLYTRRREVVLAAAAALAVLWGGLVLTLSQSSLVALLAGLAVLAALRWPARRVLPAIAGALAIGAAIVVLAPSVSGFDISSSRALDTGSSGRLDLLTGGGEIVADHPLLGTGSAGFVHAYHRLDGGDRSGASASHTIPLTVAAEQGPAGLLVYLALLAVALALLLRGAQRDPARAVVAAAVVALIIHTFIYAAFLEDPMTWALLALGSALAARAAARDEAAAAGTAALAG